MNFTKAWETALYGKRIEPEKRLVGGSYGWAAHRFPIKGGINPHEMLERTINADYPQEWDSLFKKKEKTGNPDV